MGENKVETLQSPSARNSPSVLQSKPTPTTLLVKHPETLEGKENKRKAA
jgi:hypothetical protein